jgi:hypothetical protein
MANEPTIKPERIIELKKAAADFQPAIKDIPHYDEVQNKMLEQAKSLGLTWSETREFSSEVHRLNNE